MTAYSLINYSSNPLSVGIYTTLKNLYVALKDCVTEDLKQGFTKQDIQSLYKIVRVSLDNEPIKLYEFSRYGSEIKIDWKKIFDK